jgi:hypothetical protein
MTQAAILAASGSPGTTTGFKNRIINGAMVIDQRNAGASVTYNGTSGYSVDRFFAAEIGDGAFTLQQLTDAPVGFVNSLKMTVTTPQTGTLNAGLSQSIEGYNIADLNWGTANAKTITVSFWVKSSVTGALGGSIQNSAGDRSYPFNFTINTANTWEFETITIPGDTTGTWLTTNGTGMILRFMYGTSLTGSANAWAGANYRAPTGSVFPITTNGATVFITGVQLEVGTTATNFDFRSIGTELILCQRYYYKTTTGGATSAFGLAYANTTVDSASTGYYPVTMRIAPTALEQTGTAADYQVQYANVNTTCSAVPAFSASTNANAWRVILTVASGLTAGRGGMFFSNNVNSYLAWSAEL